MGVDQWVPKRFAHLSERLVTQNGIISMGVAAALVIVLAAWGAGRLVRAAVARLCARTRLDERLQSPGFAQMLASVNTETWLMNRWVSTRQYSSQARVTEDGETERWRDRERGLDPRCTAQASGTLNSGFIYII